jgi:hypothetical protein
MCRPLPRPSWRAVPVVLAGLLAGCGPNDGVRSYSVPKAAEPTPNPPAPADAPSGPTKSRLLGAVIPVGGGSSRFVKFSGPSEKIDPHAAAFDELVSSIRVPANGPPTFTAPAGARPGPQKQMRLATFQFGPADAPVDLYISDPFGGTLLENVNRWRKEVGLAEVAEAELPTVTKEVRLGDVKAFTMDFRGPGGKGGMMTPPFAGR